MFVQVRETRKCETAAFLLTGLMKTSTAAEQDENLLKHFVEVGMKKEINLTDYKTIRENQPRSQFQNSSPTNL